MTEDELAEIEALWAKASPGPWQINEYANVGTVSCPTTFRLCEMGSGPIAEIEANTAAIASARQDVPALCAALCEAWAENERLRAELGRVAPFLALHGIAGYRFVDKPEPPQAAGEDDE